MDSSAALRDREVPPVERDTMSVEASSLAFVRLRSPCATFGTVASTTGSLFNIRSKTNVQHDSSETFRVSAMQLVGFASCNPWTLHFVHLRTFFESSHFQAAVERIIIWLDINNEQFLSAHQPQLVSTLRDVVTASAKWAHVQFIVLPVPYAASLLPTFAQFMQEFNNPHNLPTNVLWLNDSERVNGARFAHSLGSNEYVTYRTAVDQVGRVSRRSARAALRFLRQLNPSIVPEHVDLSDPPSLQQSTSSSSTSSAPHLHGVRHGMILKPQRPNDSSRGAPVKRGGSGSRGQSTNNRGHWANNSGKPNNNRKGQGNRRQ